MPLTGGRRVVRLREATDAALAQVQAVLNSRAEALVVLEGAGLPTRSKLRASLDAAPDGVAIGCYPEEGRALEETIRRVLRAANVGIDPDALAWLTGQLGADQVATHAELEKLALYAGPGGRVDVDTAMHCVGDAAGLSLDDALFAATVGDVATADRALELAMAEGADTGGRAACRADALAAVVPGAPADGDRHERGRRGQGGCARRYSSAGSARSPGR